MTRLAGTGALPANAGADHLFIDSVPAIAEYEPVWLDHHRHPGGGDGHDPDMLGQRIEQLHEAAQAAACLAGGALGQWDGAGWSGSAARVLKPVPGEGVRAARLRRLFLGPAFVAALAYVDPGTVGTNVTAGHGSGTCCCGWGCWRA